jgi:hypothetical protein
MTSRPIPADLDGDLWGSSRVRGAHEYKLMASHILLAACRQEEYATEISSDGKNHGFFTASLIKYLQQVDLTRVTYSNLLAHLPTLANQHPQCDGTNKMRTLFYMNTAAIGRSFPVAKRVDGSIEVMVGSINGVVEGTKFTVDGQDPGHKNAEILVATSVQPNSATLKAQSKDLVLPDGTRVTVSDWRNDAFTLKVFLSWEHRHPLQKALLPRRGVDPSKRNFVLVNLRENADIAVKWTSDGQIAIDRCDRIIPVHADTHRLFYCPSNLDLPSAFNAIADFNYYLQRKSGQLEKQVTTELYRLTEDGRTAGRVLYVPDNAIGNLLDGGRAKFQMEEGAKYGIAIHNNSCCDLFLYLFYFDPFSYSIDVSLSTQSSYYTNSLH